jgi:hypothetical protein
VLLETLFPPQGANIFSAGVFSGSIIPAADDTYDLGTAALRWRSFYASTGFSVFHAASDANPSAQLGDAVLKLGAGGAPALEVLVKYGEGQYHIGPVITRASANLSPELVVAPNGTGTNPVITLSRTSTLSNNFESLRFDADQYITGFTIASVKYGTGTLRPIAFVMDTNGTPAEAFRITTTPTVQYSVALTPTSGKDGLIDLGAIAGLRWNNGYFYTSVQVANNGQVNPTASLDGTVPALKFGAGGGSAIDLTLSRSGVGTLRITSPPAFVASDKYLVISAAGDIHVSALGPLS